MKLLQNIIKYKQIDKFSINEDEKAHILKKARELLDQTFVFDKTWDMERCLTPFHFDEMDWNAQRNDDEEWCFMLARMDYLNYLVLASLITDDKIYAQKAKFYILDFIKTHEQIVQSPSTRTLDTGIRVMNIFEALPYLLYLNELDENEYNTIKQSLINQMSYLKANYLTKYKTSNWGSIQTCSIVSALPFIAPDEKELYNWALDELKLQFSIQVYNDGMHWEQSTMYHVEVLNYGLKAIYYLTLAGLEVPEVLYSNTKALANALMLQLTPMGGIETFGDSDRVKAHDIFTRASVIFNDGYFKFFAYKTPDIETLYTLGANSASFLNNIETKQPKTLYFDGTDSGMYTVKSDFTENASFTMFTNGSLGSGHGHSDNLHFSIYHKGKEVLIDTGRFTYREDHELRVKLKSMKAHNSIIIDDNEYCKPSDSWGYADFGLPLKNYVKHHENIHYYEGYLIGHNPLQIITRKIVVISPDIWLICDEIKCDGKHTAQRYFHFDSKFNIDEKLTNNDLNIDISGELSLKNEPCSFFYNQLENHPVICSKTEFKNHAEYITTICDKNIKVQIVNAYQEKLQTPEDVASARKFIINDNESYIVVIYHKEIYKGKKILSCEDVYYHAKTVVIHEKDNKKELIVLKA